MPIYNAEQYIIGALRSIMSQSFVDIEVICVDDASTDSSAQIVSQEAKKDQRIRLLLQERNSGAPTARNRAIEQARGRYLAFIDADDKLAEDSIAKLYQEAEYTQCDAVKGLMMVAESGKALKPHSMNQKRAYSATTLSDCLDIQHMYQYTTYLFRTSILREHNVRFNTSLCNFQDPEFLSRLLPVCERICVTMVPVYIRFLRDDSIVSSKWTHKNFEALVRGAVQARSNLLNANQQGAANLMRETYYRWWHKFEHMTALVSKGDCLELYAKMKELNPCAAEQPLFKRLLKSGAIHALTLINRGDYEACYDAMSRSLELSEQIPRAAVKIFDIVRLARAGDGDRDS